MANKPVKRSEHPYRDAFNKGVEIGNDLVAARGEMRVTIAHRVRTLRMSDKLTQEEVAERIHANVLTYRGYENCRSDIPIAYLVRIADLFNVSLDYLTGRTNDPEFKKSNNELLDERVAQLEKVLLDYFTNSDTDA